MARAALEWRAQSFAEEQKAARPIEAMEAAQNPEPQVEAIGHAPLARMLWVGASVFGERWGKKWALSESEIAQLSEATVPVLQKYLPEDLLKAGPEAVLLLAVAMVYGPKLVAPGDAEVAA